MTVDFNKPIELMSDKTITVSFIKKVNNPFYPNLCILTDTKTGEVKDVYMQYNNQGLPLTGYNVLINSLPPAPAMVIKTGFIHLYRSSMGVVYSVGPFTHKEYPDSSGKFIAAIPISWAEEA